MLGWHLAPRIPVSVTQGWNYKLLLLYLTRGMEIGFPCLYKCLADGAVSPVLDSFPLGARFVVGDSDLSGSPPAGSSMNIIATADFIRATCMRPTTTSGC